MTHETEPLLARVSHLSDLVDLSDPEHPLNPQNLPAWRKWACAAMLGAMTFTTTLSSSIFHAAVPASAKEFGVTEETMELATTLYIFGFAYVVFLRCNIMDSVRLTMNILGWGLC